MRRAIQFFLLLIFVLFVPMVVVGTRLALAVPNPGFWLQAFDQAQIPDRLVPLVVNEVLSMQEEEIPADLFAIIPKEDFPELVQRIFPASWVRVTFSSVVPEIFQLTQRGVRIQDIHPTIALQDPKHEMVDVLRDQFSMPAGMKDFPLCSFDAIRRLTLENQKQGNVGMHNPYAVFQDAGCQPPQEVIDELKKFADDVFVTSLLNEIPDEIDLRRLLISTQQLNGPLTSEEERQFIEPNATITQIQTLLYYFRVALLALGIFLVLLLVPIIFWHRHQMAEILTLLGIAFFGSGIFIIFLAMGFFQFSRVLPNIIDADAEISSAAMAFVQSFFHVAVVNLFRPIFGIGVIFALCALTMWMIRFVAGKKTSVSV